MSYIIKTARLGLRQFSIEDAPDFFDMNNHSEVLRYTGDLPFENIDHTIAFIKSYDHYQKYGFGRWTIRRLKDNAYLGFCGLKYDPTTNEVDLGYRVMQKHWGQGYATEAASASLKYGFEKLKLKRIIGRVKAQNKASQIVLEKTGMTFFQKFDFEGEQGFIYEKQTK